MSQSNKKHISVNVDYYRYSSLEFLYRFTFAANAYLTVFLQGRGMSASQCASTPPMMCGMPRVPVTNTFMPAALRAAAPRRHLPLLSSSFASIAAAPAPAKRELRRLFDFPSVAGALDWGP